ncbi:MAG: peptidylprolyl isomerase, partial [Bryobacteraceae bacterium]
AAKEPIAANAIAHEMDLLRWPLAQTGDNFFARLALRRAVATNLRDRAWLESQLAARLLPDDQESRQFYQANLAEFRAPLRFRASHLFLAAPRGCPEEVIEEKRVLIENLAKRLKNGESFPALVAQYSEDEATKKRGGDLNYFAQERMLPAIWQAVQTLREGETSAPIRSRLGFHILRLTRRLPAEQLTFDQAAGEITEALENQRRAAAVATLATQLNGKIAIAGRHN